MPQLDLLSFFPQFLWLCFFYFGFYLLLVKYFLPRMSTILKIRSLKMNSSTGSALLEMKQENEDVQNVRDQALTDALKESRSLFQKTYSKTGAWIFKVLNKMKGVKLHKMQKAYISSVSKLSTAQSLTLQNLKTVLAPYSFKVSRLDFPAAMKSSKEKFLTSKILKALRKKTAGKGAGKKRNT